MTIMLDTPAQINAARLLTGIHGVALEISTGMKPTRGFSAKQFAAGYGYTGPATKIKVLRWLVKYAVAEIGYEPSARVLKALGE